MDQQTQTNARQAASEARARWIDFQNPLKFYRQHRPGESYGIYTASYDPGTGKMSEWKQTHYSQAHGGMLIF